MCAAPGYDASGRVEDLAAELNKQISAVAIGSSLLALISICQGIELTDSINCSW